MISGLPYIFKSLHIIFLVSWFSSVFFLGRLFVYHREALDKSEDESRVLLPLFLSSERRTLYIILLPSMILSLCIGLSLMMMYKSYQQPWFHLKMLLVILFVALNIYMIKLYRKLGKGTKVLSPVRLRLLNEVPFIFLASIVFTVYTKDFFSGGLQIAMVGVLTLAFIVIAGIIFKVMAKLAVKETE